jgi:hypothetical protein
MPNIEGRLKKKRESRNKFYEFDDVKNHEMGIYAY